MSSTKITFKELSNKDKKVIWSMEKNEDDTYKVTVVYDHKKEIVFTSVPGQYVNEDGAGKKELLKEKESEELVERRMNALLSQLSQCLFTIDFYGGKINGHITSGKIVEA